MATGPKCADEAQKYILQIMESARPFDSYGAIVATDETYDGEEEWSIGSVFNEGNLREFEQESQEREEVEETAEKTFQNLDQVYNAVKNMASGRTQYSKLEGLKAFSEDYEEEMPTDNKKTGDNWVSEYREAGLVDVELSKSDARPQEEGELTEEGKEIIQSTERLNDTVFSGLSMDAEDFYRTMVTQGYGDREGHSGEKIQAFFLYGAGMGHSEISGELDTPESTLREMAGGLEGEVFTENYMFTPEGRDLAREVMAQLGAVEHQAFESGTVETELGQGEDEFFDSDGMLDM